MEHLFKPLILWLHLHPTSAGLVTFLITFFESIAILGLFIPGSVTLSAIGGLVGSGVVPAPTIFIWAIIGAILGDGLSFWIGYRYHHVIRKVWPINRFPKLITKGEEFFAKHGGKGIFLGRFVGPVRPIMPLIAGMLRVSPRKFIVVDIISGILWAPCYMIPGIIVGAAAAHFAPDKAITYVLVLLLCIFILWVVFWLSKLFLRLLIRSWQKISDYHWSRLQKHHHKLYKALREHTHPEKSRPLSLLIFSLFFLIIFLLLLVAVLTKSSWLVDFNMAISNFFQSVHNPQYVPTAIALSIYLGKYSVILFSAFVLGIYLVIRRHWNAVSYLAIAMGSAVAVIVLCKELVHYIRPQVVLQAPATFSFPSGHTLMSFVFWGYIAFLISHNNSKLLKRCSYTITGCIVFLVALSRLYLNIHWFTDIIASLLLGACILSVVVLFYRCRECQRHYKIWPLILIVLLAQIIFGSWYYQHHAKHQLQDFQLKQSISHIENSTWWYTPHSLLPIYRPNRFGQASEVLNIQWLGELSTITANLAEHGWKPAERFGIDALKSQLQGKNVTMLSPVPLIYQHQQPLLVMTKIDKASKAILILRLWNSHYLTPIEHLYIGNISYRLPIQHLLWHNRASCKQIYANVLPLLATDLNAWSTRRISFKNTSNLSQSPCIDTSAEILKIRGRVY
jgi:undecaprenyl-diphosphatase